MQTFQQQSAVAETQMISVKTGKIQNKEQKEMFNKEIELIVEGLKAQQALSRYVAKAGKGTQEFTFNKLDENKQIVQSNIKMDLGRSEFTELNHLLIERVRGLRKRAYLLNKTTRRSNERSPGFLSLAIVDPIMMKFLESVDFGFCYRAPVVEKVGKSAGRVVFDLETPLQETPFERTQIQLKQLLIFLQPGHELYGKTNSGTLTTLFAIYRILNAEHMIIPESGNTTASIQMRRPKAQNGIRELLVRMIETDIHEYEEEYRQDISALQELASLKQQLIAAIDNPAMKVVSERFMPIQTSKKSIFNPNSFKFSHFTKLNARATTKPATKSAEKQQLDSFDLKYLEPIKEQTKAIFIARKYHTLHNPRPAREGKIKKASKK